MQGLEQHRRIDVALVVGAEDHGARGRYVLAADHFVPDASQPEREPDGTMPEYEEDLVRAEDPQHDQAEWCGDERIERDEQKRRGRSDGRDRGDETTGAWLRGVSRGILGMRCGRARWRA